MSTKCPFKFGKHSACSDKVFYVCLYEEINGKEQLLQYLYYLFFFPGYFGFNWDALTDCMADFCWIKEYEILVIHKKIPALDDNDLFIYLDILRNAVNLWVEDGAHQLTVVFEEVDRDRVLAVLSNGGK